MTSQESRTRTEPLKRSLSALVLVLLLSVAACVARAAESASAPRSTVLVGQLNERQWDGTLMSLPFANVMLVGTKRGTMTDEFGRFRIEGLPVGRNTIRLLPIGYSPRDTTLDVADVDSIRLEMTLDGAEYKFSRESFVSMPPTPELLSRMGHAKTVRAYRLFRRTDAEPDTGWAALGGIGLRPIPRDSTWAASIREIFGAEESWGRGIVTLWRLDGSETCGLRFEDSQGWLDVVMWPHNRVIQLIEQEPGSPYWTVIGWFSWRGDAGSLRRWFE